MANDTEENFVSNLQKLKKFKSGTTFHLAFTDHGGRGKESVDDSLVVTGAGNYITYKNLLLTLEENIPKGSHVTFQSNSCWPLFSEAIISTKIESKLDICGATSTVSEQMSYNAHKIAFDKNGKKNGPFGAIGLNFANEYKSRNGRYPSTLDFNFHAKKGDIANMSRQPGLLTSLTYAKTQLILKKKQDPLFYLDLNNVLDKIDWNGDTAIDNFITGPQSHNIVVNDTPGAACKDCVKSIYGELIRVVEPINNLVNSNFDLLPSPFKEQSWQAKTWLKKNQKSLAKILKNNLKEKNDFIKKYERFPKEKYAATEEQWNKLVSKQSMALKEYQFNMRIIQEGKMLQDFIKSATPSERSRFQKFLDCENKPIF
ncbi:MAG: hypothetical protein EHM20_03830 [Alphaproteobacteria bacterium]|nr:MAG: hypothetical protein EHM20_03830 [Alphaproteobacteria bacterium]